jgi:hypothetical protein
MTTEKRKVKELKENVETPKRFDETMEYREIARRLAQLETQVTRLVNHQAKALEEYGFHKIMERLDVLEELDKEVARLNGLATLHDVRHNETKGAAELTKAQAQQINKLAERVLKLEGLWIKEQEEERLKGLAREALEETPFRFKPIERTLKREPESTNNPSCVHREPIVTFRKAGKEVTVFEWDEVDELIKGVEKALRTEGSDKEACWQASVALAEWKLKHNLL